MGLVPEFKSYLLIGNGRSAKHLAAYFEQLKLPFFRWFREDSPENAKLLSVLLPQCSHVILAISDSSLSDFMQEHPELKSKCLVHLSGALDVPGVFSAHPLMTFAGAPYTLSEYQEMNFICSEEDPAFEQVLPRLPNKAYRIPREHKALYHALCVLSGNFTSILWQKTFTDFDKKLALPPEALLPYLKRITKNIVDNPEQALTGPLERRDLVTIEKNMEALHGDPFRKVYQSFVSVFFEKEPS